MHRWPAIALSVWTSLILGLCVSAAADDANPEPGDTGDAERAGVITSAHPALSVRTDNRSANSIRVVTSLYGHTAAAALAVAYAAEHGLQCTVECPGPLWTTTDIAEQLPTTSVAHLVFLARTNDEDVGPWTSRGYEEVHTSEVITDRAFAVVVTPSCPLKEMSLADMRALLGGKIRNWDHFGFEARPIHVISDAWAGPMLRDVMFGTAMRIDGSTGSLEQYSEKVAFGVAGDASAIGFINSRNWLPATGLRIVRITTRSRDEAAAMPPNKLSILCRPDAAPEIKQMAAFLWRNFTEGDERTLGTWAISLNPPAREETWPAAEETPPPTDVPAVSASETGTVAVMPTQSRLRYFLPITPDQVKAYEMQLEQVLAARGVLTLLDRRELRRTLAERQLAMIAGGSSPGKTLFSADVLVEPTLVQNASHAYLSLQAIHVRTGSVLGRTTLAIDPNRSGRWELDMDGRLAAWWPRVLVNLQRARSLPIVSLRGVYCDPSIAQALQPMRARIQSSLERQPGCFVTRRELSVNTQTEMLMQAMGFALPRGDRFAAVSDYLVEARLVSPWRAELRIVRTTDGGAAAKDILGGASFDALLTAVDAWITRQGGLLARRPKSSAAPTEADDWSAEQARREFQAAERDLRNIKTTMNEASMSTADKNRPDRLVVVAGLVERCLRAHHLDPTNEQIAYRIVELASSYGDLEFPGAASLMEAAGMYLLTFPDTKRGVSLDLTTIYRGLVLHYGGGAAEGVRHTGYARWFEEQRHRIGDLESRLQAYRVLAEWSVRQAQRGIDDPETFPRGWMEHYHTALAQYLCSTSASEQQVADAIDAWSKRYDAYPQVIPPSGFLRLRVLERREDKRGALEHFAALLRSHPDPTDKFWTFLDRSPGDVLAAIDPVVREESVAWRNGQVTGDALLRLVEKQASLAAPTPKNR